MKEIFKEKKWYGNQEIERKYYRGLIPVSKDELENMGEDKRGNYTFYPPVNYRTYHPEPGIICEQDVPVKMRDGITIYADIYRPENKERVPCIVAWSCYGKRPFETTPGWKVEGVPDGTLSEMTKEEAPDPGFWCRHGYAVANVDPRGTGNSEGNVELFNSKDGEDGYDFIEWSAKQAWCTGKVGMCGNSCLAMVQWRIAAERPPHLVCICPWEGMGDMYRESLCEGGIPGTFGRFTAIHVKSKNYVDNQYEMLKEHPFANDPYWLDTIPKYENIEIPVYATAGWCHFHLMGSVEGFQKIHSKKKWIRIHREFEWSDSYQPYNLAEELLFCDRFLKGVRNGFDMIPPVRIDIMDAFDCDYQKLRQEEQFPLKRTEYKKLYLNAGDSSMSYEKKEVENEISYDAEKGEVYFIYTFQEDTELTGFMKLRTWVEAVGNDDMDLFITVKKLSTKGEELPCTVIGCPHPGAWGKLRVSHRKLDERKSTEERPYLSHDCEWKLKPGEIVPVEIPIWPHSRIWHKGQKICVQIAGRYIREEWFECKFLELGWETLNRGEHVIHTGGKYESYLQIPVIPPKYADGEYVYR